MAERRRRRRRSRRSSSSGGDSSSGDINWGPISVYKGGDLEKVLPWIGSPVGALAERYGGGRTRAAGNVLQALGTAPLQVGLHPKAATGDIYEIARGVVEAVPATYRSVRDVGAKDTASMLWEATKEDYQNRYGADWEQHAKKDPLFNFLDVFAVYGAAFRGAAVTRAMSDLGRAGVPRTAKNVWKESSRPGWISEGEARSRKLTYELPEGGEKTSFQSYSRSPTRRAFQDLSDELAERYPTVPMIGARARVTRAVTREQARDTERLMGKVGDPHSVKALSPELKTRLFWAAQIGDHSAAALKEFRDLLDESLQGGELPDDPNFRQTVLEARKRGFGRRMIDRLDKAIDTEPNDRYWRAEESLRDMTHLSEQTIKDANGFQGLHGDLKRARDRLEGLAPDSPERPQALEDVADLQGKLNSLDGDLTDLFRDRRNRIRDWRDKAKLEKSPERIAFLAQMTALMGKEKARNSIAVVDGMALATGDALDWYRRNVGTRTGENAGMVMRRTGTDDVLFQRRDVLGPIGAEQQRISAQNARLGAVREPSPFYSPLQDYVLNEMPPGGVQAKQLPGTLAKKTRKEELAETGIIDWAKSFPPEQKIPKQAVVEYLSSPANSLNLEEVHRSSKSSQWPVKFPTVKGLSAVTDPGAEYHQIIFRMSNPSRGQAEYEGKGMMHWGDDAWAGLRSEVGKNVIAHLRFHILTDKQGRKTMVVEEAQSDWLSQWLKSKRTRKEVDLTPEQEQFLLRSDELKAAKDREYDLEDQVDDLDDERHNNPGDPEHEQRYQDALAHFKEVEAENMELEAALEGELDVAGYQWEDLYQWRDTPEEVPPAPITEELLFSLAAKRILRFAADNKIERVVVPDGNVHRFRYGQMDPLDLEPGSAPNMDAVSVTRALRAETGKHNEPTNMFKRYYDPGRGINKALQAELGKEGVWEEKAFLGRYADEPVNIQSKQGNMPGSTYEIGSADWTKFRKRPRAFKQQPNWNELPRGALELLENGDKLLHLFQTADPSTVMHELGHIALFDLPEGDLAVVEDIMAGGTKLADWTETDHEDFARAFEQYVRRGEAPTPELADAFKKLAEWLRAIWETIKGSEEIELDPAVIRVYDSLFQRDPSDDVGIFIPHRATDPDLGGARTSQGIPRAGREIGDRAISRIPIFARNRLALMRQGMLNDDPGMMIEHVNRIVMLARANQIRESVLELGEPLMPDGATASGTAPDFRTQYVVKRAGRGVNKPLFDALEAADDPEEIRTEIKTFVDDYITDSSQKWEEWRGEDQLYVVDKEYVDRLFKNATGKTPGATTKPQTSTTKLIDSSLDAVRAALLYLNPGFYTANLLGNLGMMGLADPRAARHLIPSMQQARRAAYKPDTADPRWRRISVEMGRGPTSGGLTSRPPLLGREAARRGPLPVRAAENVSLTIGEWGRRSGRIIDDAMRVATWKQTASKLGYDTDAKIDQLLDDASGGKFDRAEGEKAPSAEARERAKRDLATIRDEAEQLMLDFDSMTPFEKTYLTRIIFLYPFIKASAKWPVMFVGERPLTAAALAEAGRQGEQLTEEQLGPRPESLPAWLETAARVGPGQYWAAGSVMPMAPAAGLVESLLAIGQTPETGVSRPIDYLNPAVQLSLQLAQGRSQFGQDLPAHEILRQDAPMTGLQRQLFGLKGPSEVYADPSRTATFLRSLRFLPYGINEGGEAATPAPSSSGRRRRRRRRPG